MNAMVDAKTADLWQNFKAKEHCLPNGGFPMTKVVLLSNEVVGSQRKKSACCMPGASGAMSKAMHPGIRCENAPEPADGSITAENLLTSAKDTRWRLKSVLV